MSHFFNQKNKNNHKRSMHGFSLVELLVSLTVFSIVMTISIGTLLIMIDANAKAQALSESTTNLSFALDNMTREIRTGYHYYCSINSINDPEDINTNSTHDCLSGAEGQFISFIRERDGKRVSYRLLTTNGVGVIQGNIDGGNNDWFDITSDQVDIDTFDIVALGTRPFDAGGGDADQATVDLYINGSISNGLDTTTSFSVQSHMTEHRLDTI